MMLTPLAGWTLVMNNELPPGYCTLYAQLLWLPLRAERRAAACIFFEQVLYPVVSAEPGFVGAQCLTDAVTDQLLMISFWVSEAARQGAESSDRLQTIYQQLSVYFEGQPMVATCEVLAQIR